VASKATLESHIPELMHRLPAHADEALGKTATGIKNAAKVNVVVGEEGPPHLRDAIHVEHDGPGEYRGRGR
jgi:hypothetical protein